MSKAIRFIDSQYHDLFRLPDGGTIQVEFPDHTFSARCTYIDDYHLQVAGEVFHICQFAEVLERGGGSCRPEPELKLDEAAWDMGHRGFLSVQRCEEGWDYTFYDKDLTVLDGGQLDNPEMKLNEARNAIAEDFGWARRSMTPVDYGDLMEKAEEKAAQQRASALQQLSGLKQESSRSTRTPKHKDHER